MLFFAVFSESSVGVLLGTGGIYLGLSLLSMIPKCKSIVPTKLSDGMSLFLGTQIPHDYLTAVIITLSALCLLTLSAVLCSKKTS